MPHARSGLQFPHIRLDLMKVMVRSALLNAHQMSKLHVPLLQILNSNGLEDYHAIGGKKAME